MKGLILIFVLLSGISSAIAQEKLWLDKNYQWTDDSIQAVRYYPADGSCQPVCRILYRRYVGAVRAVPCCRCCLFLDA